jgi:hypothetical protein
MTEFKKIYLQPECCVEDQEVGRMWCQDAINDCEEGNEWIEYTLASESKQRIAELEKKLSEVGDLALDKYLTDKYKLTAILFTISEDEVNQ